MERAKIMEKIQARAAKDPNFREQLKRNRQSVCKEYGIELTDEDLKKIFGTGAPFHGGQF